MQLSTPEGLSQVTQTWPLVFWDYVLIKSEVFLLSLFGYCRSNTRDYHFKAKDLKPISCRFTHFWLVSLKWGRPSVTLYGQLIRVYFTSPKYMIKPKFPSDKALHFFLWNHTSYLLGARLNFIKKTYLYRSWRLVVLRKDQSLHCYTSGLLFRIWCRV